jgi:hypothetical protein
MCVAYVAAYDPLALWHSGAVDGRDSTVWVLSEVNWNWLLAFINDFSQPVQLGEYFTIVRTSLIAMYRFNKGNILCGGLGAQLGEPTLGAIDVTQHVGQAGVSWVSFRQFFVQLGDLALSVPVRR